MPRPRIQTGSRWVTAGNDRGARSICAWLSSLFPPELRGYQYRALCFTEELHFACELQSLRPLHKHFPLPVPHLAYLQANSYSSKNEVSVFLRILLWLPIPHLSMMVLSQGPLTFCTKTHKSHNMVCVSRLVVPNSFRPHGWDCCPHQAPLSLEFSRQEHQSGFPFPSPGDLSNPRIEPASFASPALAGRFFYHCVMWGTWHSNCLSISP